MHWIKEYFQRPRTYKESDRIILCTAVILMAFCFALVLSLIAYNIGYNQKGLDMTSPNKERKPRVIQSFY